MNETLSKFLKKPDVTDKVKTVILRKIYDALLCVWKGGGVYTDMKPANVMVNPATPLENSLVKLVDLGSICTNIGEPDAVCTFPPPHTWAIFNEGVPVHPAESGCTEKTLIWAFAIAAISVYDWDQWNRLIYWTESQPSKTIVGEKNLKIVNRWMKYFQGIFKKGSPRSGVPKGLNNVRKCFAPFESADDWRGSKNPPPFKFETMFSDSMQDDDDDSMHPKIEKSSRKRLRTKEPSPLKKKARTEKGLPKSKKGFQCIDKCTWKERDYGYFTKSECGCKTAPYKGKLYGTWEWDECDQTYCESSKPMDLS